MNQRLTFQVHRVNAKIAQVANPLSSASSNWTCLSSRILVLLLERGEMRVGELVEEMVLPQSTISHQLQRLVKRKLLPSSSAQGRQSRASRCPSRGRALTSPGSATS
jgi:predicted transcriptional regulator